MKACVKLGFWSLLSNQNVLQEFGQIGFQRIALKVFSQAMITEQVGCVGPQSDSTRSKQSITPSKTSKGRCKTKRFR
jgi:hypothetical protein